MLENNQPDDRSKNQSGDSDIDYETSHSDPRPGASEYIPEDMDGLGPTGYRRSDEDVIHEVVQKLANQPGINASQIDASIRDGVVVLNGTVVDEDQKLLAEDAVQQVPGVVRVDNRLHTDIDMHHPRKNAPFATGVVPENAEEMNSLKTKIRLGMPVLGSQGKSLGKVKEIRDQDFLLDRPMARDVYVPFDAIQSVEHQVTLNISADQLGDQNWPSPGLMGD